LIFTGGPTALNALDQGHNQLIFFGGKVIASCCTIFVGQNGCNLLLYRTTKRVFEKILDGIAHTLVSGLYWKHYRGLYSIYIS